MDILLLYLFMQADAFKNIFEMFCWLGGAGCGLSLFGCMVMCDEEAISMACLTAAKKIFPYFVAALFMHALFPSSKTLAVMIGGHYAIEATKSETAKKIMTLVDATLDKALEKTLEKAK